MLNKHLVAKLLVACSVLVLGVTAASAQSCQDVIDKRQNFMKRSADLAKAGSAMIKGDAPFDLDKTKEIFSAFAEDAAAMPTLFPDCSKTGDHTTAAPAVWDKPDDFKAAIAKFAADVKAAQDSTKDLDSLKAGFQTIGKDCGSCHQTFRVRPS
jgi:cytochrome c556